METITSKILRKKENQTECECGNKTIYQYSWSNGDGQTICPLCMDAWRGDQIIGLKKLVYELSSKSKEETAAKINEMYAHIMGVDMEHLNDMEFDYSEI